MHCFYHDPVEAVAICKNCNRGVCRECAVELVNGIACKNRCEAEVEAVNQIIERSKTSYQKTSSAFSRNAIVYLMFAVVFGFWALIRSGGSPGLVWTMLAIAIVFLIASLFSYSTSRRYLKVDTDKRT